MKLSEEVRTGYLNHVCDELPTDEWADRIAALEQQLADVRGELEETRENGYFWMAEHTKLKQELEEAHVQHNEHYNTAMNRALDAEQERDQLKVELELLKSDEVRGMATTLVQKENKKLKQQIRIARRMLERAGETMDSVRVFVTSREQIKQPEGEEWYDDEREALFGLPYSSQERCPDEV